MIAPDLSSNYAISIIAGGVAGGVEAAVTYPFEYAKTRTQLRTITAMKQQTNPFLVVRDLLRNEGLQSMYRGSSIFVVGSIGKDALRFCAFDCIKRRFADRSTGSLSPIGNLMAGIATGVIASTVVVTPTERLKTSLIDDGRRQTPKFRSATQALSTIFCEGGLAGLYRGYAATTLKQVGATAFRLGSYNIMKDIYVRQGFRCSVALDFATGGLAGLITTLATQPFDVIKTRSQSTEGTTTMNAMREVYRDGGVRGFWKGTTMRLGRTILSGAILFTTYEHMTLAMRSMVLSAPRSEIL